MYELRIMKTTKDYGRSSRAGNGVRTRDIQLGKLMLYQLSYSRLRVEMPGVEPGSEVENPKHATCVFDL